MRWDTIIMRIPVLFPSIVQPLLMMVQFAGINDIGFGFMLALLYVFFCTPPFQVNLFPNNFIFHYTILTAISHHFFLLFHMHVITHSHAYRPSVP